MIDLYSYVLAVKVIPDELHHLVKSLGEMVKVKCTDMSDIASEFIQSQVVNVEESKPSQLFSLLIYQLNVVSFVASVLSLYHLLIVVEWVL